MVGNVPVSCGRCLPCKINIRRMWTIRQMLESYTHTFNSFVTLTYNDMFLPEGGNLVKADLQRYLKRVRKALGNDKMRYFACGEYGDKGMRPHYHLSVFGMGQNRTHKEILQKAWRTAGYDMGHVLVAEFNKYTAQYTCGYVVKKMTYDDDPRLCGRKAEFATMSRRPGLGAPAMEVIANTVNDDDSAVAALEQFSDVPAELKKGKGTLPLPRYLRQRLRKEMGYTDEYIEKIKQDYISEKSKEMCALFSRAIQDEEGCWTPKQLLLKENLGAIRNVEARHSLRERKSL